MMRKVCPSCKDCDQVTEVSYPETRHVRAWITPDVDKNDKVILNDFDLDVREEWCEFTTDAQEPDYFCVECGHHYRQAVTFDDVWNEMVWRKRK